MLRTALRSPALRPSAAGLVRTRFVVSSLLDDEQADLEKRLGRKLRPGESSAPPGDALNFLKQQPRNNNPDLEPFGGAALPKGGR